MCKETLVAFIKVLSWRKRTFCSKIMQPYVRLTKQEMNIVVKRLTPWLLIWKASSSNIDGILAILKFFFL
jgi:hypothetical protein